MSTVSTQNYFRKRFQLGQNPGSSPSSLASVAEQTLETGVAMECPVLLCYDTVDLDQTAFVLQSAIPLSRSLNDSLDYSNGLTTVVDLRRIVSDTVKVLRHMNYDV
jgi:hypothetical protein